MEALTFLSHLKTQILMHYNILVLATSLVSSPILTNVKFLENMEEIAAAVLRPLFTDHLGWCQLGGISIDWLVD